MTVYDRWHKTGPGEPCRQHRQVPSAAHGAGDRWQVRWRDEDGRQRSRNFRLKEGRNPGLHADALDAKITRELHTGGYVDPSAGDITLQAYAEDWRKTRSHDTGTAEGLERRLRLHVYENPRTPGKTRRGGVAIGQRKMAELSRRPSLVHAARGRRGGAAWRSGSGRWRSWRGARRWCRRG